MNIFLHFKIEKYAKRFFIEYSRKFFDNTLDSRLKKFYTLSSFIQFIFNILSILFPRLTPDFSRHWVLSAMHGKFDRITESSILNELSLNACTNISKIWIKYKIFYLTFIKYANNM